MAGFGLPNFRQLTGAFRKAQQIQQDAQKLQEELDAMLGFCGDAKAHLAKLDKLIKLLPNQLEVSSTPVGAAHRKEDAAVEQTTELKDKLASALSGATVGPEITGVLGDAAEYEKQLASENAGDVVKGLRGAAESYVVLEDYAAAAPLLQRLS